MSDYFFAAKYKVTGAIVNVEALDDYFGKHKYGFKAQNRMRVMSQPTFDKYYEVTDEQVTADVLDIANQITEREFIVTDACMWEQNKQQGAFHPHAIEVVDTETGQVRLIESGARIKFVSGKISSSRTQDDYNNQ